MNLSYVEIKNKLKKKYNQIGEGAFVTVFENKKQEKVFRIHKEKLSLKFYEYCMNNPDINLPKIHRIITFDDGYISVSNKYHIIPVNNNQDLSNLIYEYLYLNKMYSEYEMTVEPDIVHQIKIVEVKLRKLNKIFVSPDSPFQLDVDYTNLMYDGENIIINDPYYMEYC